MQQTLIVFDIDGTLTNSMHIHHEAFMLALEKIGVTNYVPFQRKFKHFTDSFVVRDIYQFCTGSPLTQDLYSKFSESLSEEISKKKIQVLEGAADLVSNLQGSKMVDVCFATGSLLKPALHKLSSANIAFEEEVVASSDNIEERENIVKLSIEKAKNHYNKNFDRIVSIGDGIWDLETAKNLGLEFIGIGAAHKGELIERGCKLHFDSPKQLLEGYRF